MTVYILDDDTPAQNRRDWSFLTGRTDLRSIGRQGHRLSAAPRGDELAAHVDGVVFIHSSYCPASELQHISANYPGLVLILVSAGGIVNGPRGSAFWSVGRAVSKPPDRDDYFAERAKEFLADYANTGIPDFQKLEPNIEAPLAFRLLQEAKLVCGEKDRAKLYGIPIYAPMCLRDWLNPFGDGEAAQLREMARLIFENGATETTQKIKNAMTDEDALRAAVSEYLQVVPSPASQI